ncbi:MAG: TonB-dependent receptor [Acidobacteriota bacterium]
MGANWMGMRAGVVAILVSAALAWAAPTEARQAAVAGKVTRDTGEVMAGALVVIDELKRETRTTEEGTFRFENVPPGNYHVSVRAEGYSSRRTEIAVGPQGATVDLIVALDLHFAEVLSVSPNARAQFESYQATSVLAGQALQQELEGTVGATLQAEPGIAMRSLGPGAARPVIRGLDGDRIVVLQDGQRSGDLSSQSGDHGVTINPASAQRIEVVRGPATLLYGASAIGGLVNVITDQIPSEKVEGAHGDITLDLASNAGQAGGAGDVHFGNGRVAVHVGGGGRRSGNFDTPEAEVDNSQTRAGFVSLGASWTGDRTYAGGSYAFDDLRYGVPIVEGGEISLTPRRHAFTFRSGGRALEGLFSSYRATLGVKRYEHTEFEGDEVGTVFQNDSTEGELLLSHRPFGKLSGTIGGWFLTRAFAADGEEALAPPIDQRSMAAFVYEELTWPHVTAQFGGRVDHTRFEPDGGLPERDFTEFSGSVGLLVRPQAASDRFAIALSLARAARNPALEELYYFGPHIGNLAYEIGNPELTSERAVGVDVALRLRTSRVRAEVSFFRNAIDDFIFRNPLSEEEFEEREDEFDARFGVVHSGDDGHHGEELPFVEFVGADSVLYGLEAHADVNLTDRLVAELTWDWVRGELSTSGDPLPRIPPYRVLAGLRYQRNALQAGASVQGVGRQSRVFGAETETAGYGLLKLFASYSFERAGVLNTLTARLDNATNRTYRNHLNYLKDVLPEMGRSFRVVYSMGF